MILTLATAKAHLLITTPAGDPGDVDLTAKLQQAEAIILDYCATTAARQTDVAGWTDATTTPQVVQAAILLQLGELFRFRGDDQEAQGAPRPMTDDDLAPVVARLLRRWRDPVVQ